MLLLVFVLSLTWVSAQLQETPDPTDPPRVMVDPTTLQKFGVTIDVNRPGLFKNLMSLPSSFDSANTAFKQQADLVTLQAKTLIRNSHESSAVNFSNDYIQLYSGLPEGMAAQLVAAHFLNVYARFFNTLTDNEGLSIRSIQQLLDLMDTNPSGIDLACRANQFNTVAANHITHELDQPAACSELTAMATHGGDEANNMRIQLNAIVSEVQNALNALNVVNKMVYDPTVSLKSIADFVTSNGVVPRSFSNLLLPLLTQAFQDYPNWLASITAQEADQLSNLLGENSVFSVRGFVIQAAFNMIRAQS